MVIDELNYLDDNYGVGSVVIHDSMFFQNPKLAEGVDRKVSRARPTKSGPTGRRAGRTPCASGPICSRR